MHCFVLWPKETYDLMQDSPNVFRDRHGILMVKLQSICADCHLQSNVFVVYVTLKGAGYAPALATMVW